MFLQTAPKFNGHDLLMTDILRGRDTGMPPYNSMRSVCGIPEARTFDDLTDLIAYEVRVKSRITRSLLFYYHLCVFFFFCLIVFVIRNHVIWFLSVFRFLRRPLLHALITIIKTSTIDLCKKIDIFVYGFLMAKKIFKIFYINAVYSGLDLGMKGPGPTLEAYIMFQ